jgi:arylsulfatase A-like enzyme
MGSKVRALDALPALLRRAGYATAYFFPSQLTLPEEEWAVRHLGFDHVDVGSHPGGGASATRRLSAERAMFGRGIAWLRDGRPAGRPFLLLIRTMLGHDRLIDPAQPDSLARWNVASQAAGRRFTAREEDALLGTVLDRLEEIGELDSTILVVVADHGARTKGDVRIRTWVLNDLTYRVPALIASRAVIPRPSEVTVVTSHVDLTPTILDLLGWTAGRWLHHGLSVFDPRLAERATFVLGEGFAGVDGVIGNGWFYAKDYLRRMEHLSPDLSFTDDEVFLPGDAVPPHLADLRDRLGRLRNLQLWIARSLAGDTPGGRG